MRAAAIVRQMRAESRATQAGAAIASTPQTMATPHDAVTRSTSSPRDDRHPWAIRIGRALGIPIDVHVTFLVLLASIALAPLASGGSLEDGIESAGFMALVFATVVLHELGHATVARRFGFETTRILLLPIGGLATLTRMPTRPLEELLVAIAGPLVNVVLAIAIGALLFLSDPSVGLTGATSASGPFLIRLLWVNLGLAVLHLLPAFPMDGGRVLRALLSVFLERSRATRIAVAVGRAVALVLGIVGLALQPVLALIALFVWSAGRMEIVSEDVRHAMEGVTIGRVMTKRVVGLRARGEVLRGMAHGELGVSIEQRMHRDFATAFPGALLEDTLPRLEASGRRTMVVLDGAELVGVLDAESLGELSMVENARRAAAYSIPAAP